MRAFQIRNGLRRMSSSLSAAAQTLISKCWRSTGRRSVYETISSFDRYFSPHRKLVAYTCFAAKWKLRRLGLWTRAVMLLPFREMMR